MHVLVILITLESVVVHLPCLALIVVLVQVKELVTTKLVLALVLQDIPVQIVVFHHKLYKLMLHMDKLYML